VLDWPGLLRPARTLHPISSAPLAWFVRVFSLALLTLIGSAQVLPALHHLTTPHAVCAEHGELTHLSEAEAEAESSSEPRSAEPTLRAVATVEDEHEHCAVPALGSSPALASGDAATSCLTLEASAPRLGTGSTRAESSLPILAVAPKLAPPV
jgi:hypothetical protein